MEAIIFLVITLLITLIKNLNEQGKGTKTGKPILQPKYEKYPTEGKAYTEGNTSPKMKKVTIDTPSKTQYNKKPLVQTAPIKASNKSSLEEEKKPIIEEEKRELSFEHGDLVKGFIMSEILEKPRFKNPYKFR